MRNPHRPPLQPMSVTVEVKAPPEPYAVTLADLSDTSIEAALALIGQQLRKLQREQGA